MIDVGRTIQAKSDQLNADDLIGRSITITITDVTERESKEQPIAIWFDGDNGRPFIPCKSMRKVLVHNWGRDGHSWIGRRMTLFRDPAVMYGGQPVGGTRISHIDGIDKPVTMALTVTRGSKKPYTVKPLPPPSPSPEATHSAASPAAPQPDTRDVTGAAGNPDEGDSEIERLERRRDAITKEAKKGRAALNAEWKRTTKADGDAFGGVKGEQMAEWIRIAKEADERTPLVMAG